MPLNDGFKERGLCRYAPDPEIWWPNGTTGDEELKITEAKQVCDICPVKLECLLYAVEERQYFGIWGGTTEEERKEGRRAHRRILAEQVDTEREVQVA